MCTYVYMKLSLHRLRTEVQRQATRPPSPTFTRPGPHRTGIRESRTDDMYIYICISLFITVCIQRCAVTCWLMRIERFGPIGQPGNVQRWVGLGPQCSCDGVFSNLRSASWRNHIRKSEKSLHHFFCLFSLDNMDMWILAILDAAGIWGTETRSQLWPRDRNAMIKGGRKWNLAHWHINTYQYISIHVMFESQCPIRWIEMDDIGGCHVWFKDTQPRCHVAWVRELMNICSTERAATSTQNMAWRCRKPSAVSRAADVMSWRFLAKGAGAGPCDEARWTQWVTKIKPHTRMFSHSNTKWN